MGVVVSCQPWSASSSLIRFLISIVLCLLTRSAISVIVIIILRPVSAAVVICVRVLFLFARTIISSCVARCLRVCVSLYDLGSAPPLLPPPAPYLPRRPPFPSPRVAWPGTTGTTCSCQLPPVGSCVFARSQRSPTHLGCDLLLVAVVARGPAFLFALPIGCCHCRCPGHPFLFAPSRAAS